MFDDGRLDDEGALRGVDLRLRHLAEAGARVRRDAASALEVLDVAVERLGGSRPRALLVTGPGADLVRAALETRVPVPLVTWPADGPDLPAWAGSLDLVLVLAPQGDDPRSAAVVAGALRRGCSLVVVAPERSLAAEPLSGGPRATADRVLLPTGSGDPLGSALAALAVLHRLGLGTAEDADEVADALDVVAVECSPYRELADNRTKQLASALADTVPLVWGGSRLAALAADRTADAVRRASGGPAVAGDLDRLVPVLELARGRDVFADPFEDQGGPPPASLLVVDDGVEEPGPLTARSTLVGLAEERGLRSEALDAGSAPPRSDVARHVALAQLGEYAATYLGLGLL